MPVVKRDNNCAKPARRSTPIFDGEIDKTCINNGLHLPAKDSGGEHVRLMARCNAFEGLPNVMVHEYERWHEDSSPALFAGEKPKSKSLRSRAMGL
jgi:hypothetical protein